MLDYQWLVFATYELLIPLYCVTVQSVTVDWLKDDSRMSKKKEEKDLLAEVSRYLGTVSQ